MSGFFSGDVFDLNSGECIEKGVITRVTSRIANTKEKTTQRKN